jgi:hypothetical protein
MADGVRTDPLASVGLRDPWVILSALREPGSLGAGMITARRRPDNTGPEIARSRLSDHEFRSSWSLVSNGLSLSNKACRCRKPTTSSSPCRESRLSRFVPQQGGVRQSLICM